MLIAIITINKLQKHQIDVKVALLNGASMMRFT
jgi:sRNA-binding regulator protein Hfq